MLNVNVDFTTPTVQPVSNTEFVTPKKQSATPIQASQSKSAINSMKIDTELPVLSIGVGASVDDVIQTLQDLGLVTQ
jgi:hypothetical protein